MYKLYAYTLIHVHKYICINICINSMHIRWSMCMHIWPTHPYPLSHPPTHLLSKGLALRQLVP